jgi:dTDP-4-dehydrorhamnose reductase
VCFALRVLVIGGSGLVGYKINELFARDEYEVFCTYHQQVETGEQWYQMDITDKDQVSSVFQQVRPEVVVLPAAFTDVDACETDRKQAFAVNVRGTKKVAQVAEKHHARLVYLSTDYVFNGHTGNYKEDDLVDPLNYYGKTKLLGEEQVKAWCSEYLICRTSVVYGVNKANFALWLVDNLQKEKNVRIVDDQWVSCTYNKDLAEQIRALVTQNATGVFHTAGGERISRYDFSCRLAEVFGFDVGLIEPVRLQDFNWVAQRPRDSSLDVTKVSKFKKPLTVNESLTRFFNEWKETHNEKRIIIK